LSAENCLFAKEAYESAAQVVLPDAAKGHAKIRLYALARIPDFGQANQIASELGKPVFCINDDDFRQIGLRGNVKASVQQNVETFDQIFSAICDKIIAIIEYDRRRPPL
jgi:chromosome partitioning protein